MKHNFWIYGWCIYIYYVFLVVNQFQISLLGVQKGVQRAIGINKTLTVYKLQPFLYSLFTNWLAASKLVIFILTPSQSNFLRPGYS